MKADLAELVVLAPPRPARESRSAYEDPEVARALEHAFQQFAGLIALRVEREQERARPSAPQVTAR